MVSMRQVVEAFPVILGLVARGAILLAVAGVVCLGLRRASAATRHLVWAAAMTGLLALPLAGVLAPDLRVPVPAAFLPGALGVDVTPEAAASAGVAVDHASREVPTFAATSRAAPADGSAGSPAPVDGPASSASRGASAGAESTVGKPDPRAGIRAAAGVDAGSSGIPLAGWLTAIWLLGTLVLLTPVAASVVAIRRLRNRLPVLDAPQIRHRATRLALRVGVGSFRLLEGDEGAMPMTFGARRPAILLPSTARTWSAERLDAVLLHELAHVRRRDTLTQMVAEVARAIHWINPLAWLAIRRLEVEREHACDDIALARGARPSSYADEILGLARRYRAGRVAGRAALALARPGRLSQRLRAVLDDERRRDELPRGAAWKATALAAAAVVALAALAPTVATADPFGPDPSGPAGAGQEASAAELSAPTWPPAPGVSGRTVEPARGATLDRASGSQHPAIAATLQDPTCISEPGEWDSIQSRSNNGRRTVVLERRGCELEVRLEGEIQLDAAGIGVARMGRDARLTIEEDDGRMIRSLEVLPGDGDGLVFEYRENRRGQEFGSAARAWYRAVLLELFRTTGFMADARVRTLLEQGGVEAVLRELGQLRGDLAYAKHVEALLEQARLEEAETRALIRGSADRVDSDHYLAGILQRVAEHQEMTRGTLDDFLQATRRLDSDHYRTEALSTALTSGRLSDDQVGLVLQAAGEMDSDHYRTQILGAVADRYALQPAFRQLYLQATASMDSDHYRTEVLNRLLDRNDLSAAEKAGVLETASMLDSDHYRTELLRNVAGSGLGEPALHEAYFRVAAGLDSDHYYREAMGLLLRESVADEMLVTVLHAAARELESDHYKADLLMTVLEGRALEGRVRQAFLDAMDSMESEHYRGRVADALLRAERR